MKRTSTAAHRNNAFTIVEMIGLLAILGTAIFLAAQVFVLSVKTNSTLMHARNRVVASDAAFYRLAADVRGASAVRIDSPEELTLREPSQTLTWTLVDQSAAPETNADRAGAAVHSTLIRRDGAGAVLRFDLADERWTFSPAAHGVAVMTASDGARRVLRSQVLSLTPQPGGAP